MTRPGRRVFHFGEILLRAGAEFRYQLRQIGLLMLGFPQLSLLPIQALTGKSSNVQHLLFLSPLGSKGGLLSLGIVTGSRLLPCSSLSSCETARRIQQPRAIRKVRNLPRLRLEADRQLSSCPTTTSRARKPNARNQKCGLGEDFAPKCSGFLPISSSLFPVAWNPGRTSQVHSHLFTCNLLSHPPRRRRRPSSQFIDCPARGLLGMARGTRVGDA
jgi:hypothetical protein